MQLKLEPASEGLLWIGGRRAGKTCERVWNGELWRLGHCGDTEVEKAYVAISHLGRLVDYLCRALGCVYEGRFDRRYSQCVYKNAEIVELCRSRLRGTL